MLANHERNAASRLVHLCLAILARETGRISGWYGLDQRDASKAQPVLFYLLKAAHWGQGLATEVAKAVLVGAALLGWLLRGWHVKEARRG
jgi:RimJ/RimL family protein N-acetyltransferase